MSATAKILEWAAGRPAWQRDALRRLATSPELNDEDVADILAMLKAAHGLAPGGGAPQPVPLAAKHLPDTAKPGEQVTLAAICDVKNAMRLKNGEKLTFAPAGLTLIYGDNGSGKSGYARILKRATRSRGQEKKRLLANVFNDGFEKAPPATAKILAAVTRDGKTKEVEIGWEDGKAAPDLLASVRVFDNKAAAVYVNDRSEVAFVPFNLDLLQMLAELCDDLRRKIEGESAGLEGHCLELANSVPDAGNARQFVGGLTAYTTQAQIDENTLWNGDEDEPKLAELQAKLTDAAAQVVALKGRRTRCEALRRRVEKIEPILSDERAAALKVLRDEAVMKRSAADKLSKEAFQKEPLSGVGDGPWRVLWDAARDYSIKIAYEGREFPVVDDEEARCVLCQRPLDDEARDRMERFQHYVEGKVSKDALAAENALMTARAVLEGLDVDQTAVDEALIEEVDQDFEDLAQNITDFFIDAAARRAALVAALVNGDFTTIGDAPEKLSVGLAAYGDALEGRAKEIEGALDPEEREKLKGEHARLLGRKTLAAHKATIEKIVAHKATIRKLGACRFDVQTQQITTTKKALEEDFLMKPFRVALQEELDALEVEQKVTLGFVGEKAVTKQKPEFDGTKFDKLDEVLSEGEHRAVALACFLAEVRQLPGKSPIIIDDPVSSLDHIRRERVARRLVKEAKERQVVVLTHEMTFYTDLVAKANEQPVGLRRHALVRTAEGYGHVDGSGVPWPAKEVPDRLQFLEAVKLPELRKLRAANDPSYRERARGIGELLRETWERLVEEALFGNVVIRFRPSVETLRLQEVAVDDPRWVEVHWGMSRTSAWAHDEAANKGAQPPSPNDLKEEIDRIRACAAAINKERDKIRARRKKLLEAPVG